MYSRYNNRPVRVPENYSGVAFSEHTAPSEKPNPAPHRLEVAKPTPPPYGERKEPPAMPPPPRAIVLPKKEDGTPPPPPNALPKESPPQTDKEPPHGEKEHHDERREEHREEHREVAFLKPFQGLFGQIGHAFPFSHGIGFDELLLLGLIILLSQGGEENSDIVLWLALLLFCG